MGSYQKNREIIREQDDIYIMTYTHVPDWGNDSQEVKVQWRGWSMPLYDKMYYNPNTSHHIRGEVLQKAHDLFDALTFNPKRLITWDGGEQCYLHDWDGKLYLEKFFGSEVALYKKHALHSMKYEKPPSQEQLSCMTRINAIKSLDEIYFDGKLKTVDVSVPELGLRNLAEAPKDLPERDHSGRIYLNTWKFYTRLVKRDFVKSGFTDAEIDGMMADIGICG